MRYLLLFTILLTGPAFAFSFMPPIGLFDEGKITFQTDSVIIDGVATDDVKYDVSMLYSLECKMYRDSNFDIKLSLNNIKFNKNVVSDSLIGTFTMDQTGKIINAIKWDRETEGLLNFIKYATKYAALIYRFPNSNAKKRWETEFNFPNTDETNRTSIFIGNWNLVDITPKAEYVVDNDISMWVPPDQARAFFPAGLVENCNLTLKSEYLVDTYFSRTVSTNSLLVVNVKLDGRQHKIYLLGNTTSVLGEPKPK
jgi:hypothetical protein